MQDYVSGNELSDLSEDEFELHLTVIESNDLVRYEEAAKHTIWRRAMK